MRRSAGGTAAASWNAARRGSTAGNLALHACDSKVSPMTHNAHSVLTTNYILSLFIALIQTIGGIANREQVGIVYVVGHVHPVEQRVSILCLRLHRRRGDVVVRRVASELAVRGVPKEHRLAEVLTDDE